MTKRGLFFLFSALRIGTLAVFMTSILYRGPIQLQLLMATIVPLVYAITSVIQEDEINKI